MMYVTLLYIQLFFIIFIIIFQTFLLKQIFNFMNYFALIFLIYFPLSALYQYYTGDYSIIAINFLTNQNNYIYSAFLSFMSIVLVSLFYYIFYIYTNVPTFKYHLKVSIFNNIIFLVFFLISSFSFLIIMNMYGGILNFLSQVNEYRSGGGIGMGFLQYPATMLMPIILFLYIISRKDFNNYNKRIIYLFIFLLTLLPLIVFGFRGPVVVVLIQFAIIYNFFIKQINIAKLIIVLCILIIILVFWAATRIEFDYENFEAVYTLFFDTVIFRTKGIEVVAAIVAKPQYIEYNFFIPNLLESFTSFLPRIIFPWKDVSIAEIITTKYFSNDLFSIGIIKDIYGGVSSTYIGQSYWAHGTLGVILISIFIGVTLGILQKLYSANKNNNISIIFIAIFFSHIHFFVESFQLAINAIIMNSLVVIVLLILLKKEKI